MEQVAGDHELGRLFVDAVHGNHGFAASGREFADLWPIFKSSEIRRRGIRVQTYFQNNITFEPSCWHDHHGQRPPLDWKHTLKTLYRVRCNLFHGEKTLDSENDRQIVSAAYPVLEQVARLLELIP